MSTDARPTILIVDDEPAIREMVEFTLSVDDIPCFGAASVAEAKQLIDEVTPDLILLDWMLPGGESGVDFTKALRAGTRRSYIPIIMLTARAGSPDKVAALDAGADDYIAKPFSPSELKARIRAVLRRMTLSNGQASVGFVDVNGLTLDPTTHRVRTPHGELEIGPTEFKLLHFFMTHAERIFSRAELIRYVWPANTYVEERTVDVHIRHLRAALEPGGYRGMIQTVRGMGYRFCGG